MESLGVWPGGQGPKSLTTSPPELGCTRLVRPARQGLFCSPCSWGSRLSWDVNKSNLLVAVLSREGYSVRGPMPKNQRLSGLDFCSVCFPISKTDSCVFFTNLCRFPCNYYFLTAVLRMTSNWKDTNDQPKQRHRFYTHLCYSDSFGISGITHSFSGMLWDHCYSLFYGKLKIFWQQRW